MKDNIKVIIIDDESLARQISKNYLSRYDNIEIVAECSNGFDAIKKINARKPDIIFLDIQMPKLNGFEMLELIENPPVIIFTTAYDHFAIKAFEVSAVDYLLKPFSEERFNQALKKAIKLLDDKYKQADSIRSIIAEHEKKIETLERVVIKDGGKINIIPVNEMRWIEAQDDYVMIHSDKGKFLKQKTMKYFEDHLDETQFVRIHRSYIINLSYLQHLEQQETDSYKLILKNGKELPVSKTGLSRLKATL
ncbi:MAG: LytTR family transcriptional regulator DNA-binding domain-containing protein [Ignavibacteriaceae bacterium]|nr:LytTR family transcriptional regulator DNA-binding domain-containing protein [Ignavibacteriaceae bacterium]